MGIEALIMLLITVIVVLGITYAICWALGNAGAPRIIINGVWLVAALILLLILLRQIGLVHL